MSAPELPIELKQRTVPIYLDGEVAVLETPGDPAWEGSGIGWKQQRTKRT